MLIKILLLINIIIANLKMKILMLYKNQLDIKIIKYQLLNKLKKD